MKGESEFAELRRLLAAQTTLIHELTAKLELCLISDPASVSARNAHVNIESATAPKAFARRQNGYPRIEKSAYRQLVQRLRDLLLKTLPPGAIVSVVSKGDEDLVRLDGLQGWHFPRTEGGLYAGYHPGSSGEATLYLETDRSRGAAYLAVPKTAFWWFDNYAEFTRHLSKHYPKVIDDPETCVVYQLESPCGARGDSRLQPAQLAPVKHAPSREMRLFDLNWYMQQCPDVGAAGIDPLEHYLTTGAKAGHDPHPLFDSDWYLEQNPDVAAAGVNPLEHYLLEGARQGRSPHPMFDAKWYGRTYPETFLAGQSPLEHYLTTGWKNGCRPNPKFDPAFYLTTYPEIHAAGLEPLTQFICNGLREGRLTNPHEVSFEPYRPAFKIARSAHASQSAIDESIRAIAFYLPQFHPIRENDRWWGKGFTEWTNVQRGKAQFQGHYQPHVPSTLGYYDLRDPKMLEQQAALGRANGIYGFCFYYYWFSGKVVLDRPLRNLMSRGKPDFPFCLCWANENWTRRWDGMDHEVLIAQQHSPEDDLAFLQKIEPALLHRNYIRVDGKPLLLVYRPGILPEARATTDRWRDYFRSQGHGELYLAMTQAFGDRTPPAEYGFDASIQFPPHEHTRPVTSLIPDRKPSFRGSIFDYEQTKLAYLEDLLNSNERPLFPGVMPSWDNTARRQSASQVWVNASPESYYEWLAKVVAHLRRTRPEQERLLFINAWNEWGEGCHLEPDRKHGHAWLNATRLALQSASQDEDGATTSIPSKEAPPTDVANSRAKRPLEVAFVSHDAYPHGAQYCLLTLVKWLKESGLVDPRFILAGPGPLTEEFARLGPVLRFDALAGEDQSGQDRIQRLLRSFCGPSLSAVYVNSAAAGHVCRWTKHLGVPHLAHIHELEESIRRWVGKHKMATLRRSVDMVVAASDPVARNLRIQHAFDPESIKIIHESIRCTKVRRIGAAAKQRCKSWLGLDSKAKIVLGCGTTDWRKAPDLFIDVAAMVLRKYRQPVQFIWVGAQSASEKNQLQELIDARQIGNVVQFVGAVANPLPYMLASELFLLPSREDPFPLVCLEAADCGLPTICFAKAGGMPDFVAPDCGAVVPYLNVQRMSHEVVSFLEDDAMRRDHGQCAREKVRSQFDVSVKGREIYELLETLCAEPPQRKKSLGKP